MNNPIAGRITTKYRCVLEIITLNSSIVHAGESMRDLKYPPFYDRTDLYLYNEWQKLNLIQRAYIYLKVQRRVQKRNARIQWYRELRRQLMAETEDQKIKFDCKLSV